MRLLLFDIDGTLIRTSRVGRQVMRYALEKVFGTAGPIEEYPFAGGTDKRIIRDLLKSAGIPQDEITAGFSSVYEHMAKEGKILFYQDGLSACPGILNLLSILTGRRDVLLGLQTGNTRITAQLKLEAASVDPSVFHVGAYGSDTDDRRRLIPIAWQRTSRQLSRAFDGHNTVVLGDTPADIDCAKANHAMSVAVATGSYTSELLAEYHPDILFDDFSDIKAVVDRLLT